MISVDIDYLKIRVPTYMDKFSRIPRFVNNKNDPFICTASFTEEYMKHCVETKEEISRTAKNMQPAFFVYEFDTLSLDEQRSLCKSITENPKFENRIFSQTFSGRKSYHTLVPIDPQYRNDIAMDFKYYWLFMAKIFFGERHVMLDPQCASIGRLSRNPNGVREDGTLQECIYYNPNATLTNWGFESKLESHTSEILKARVDEQILRNQQTKIWNDQNVDEFDKLERLHASGNKSEAFDLAYDIIINHNCPKGANYISAAASLKGCGFSRGFTEEMLNMASSAHPTNISKHSVSSILAKLYK